MCSQEKESPNNKTLSLNKKARFDYEILDKYEAGIVLTGEEVKSIRAGGMSIVESYIKGFADGMYILGANVRQFAHSSNLKYDPIRPRKLLLHKQEITKLTNKVDTKGLTIVPLAVYIKKGKIKIEIAVAKGKNAPDKREATKLRDVKRDLSRSVSQKLK